MKVQHKQIPYLQILCLFVCLSPNKPKEVQTYITQNLY